MTNSLKDRKDMNEEYMWDISSMYPQEDLWQQDLDTALALAEDFTGYSGKVAKDPDTLLAALKDRSEIWQKVEKAFVYARMRRDEDNRVEKYQAMCDSAYATLSRISALMSFFTPELLDSPAETVLSYIDKNPDLEIYRFYLTDLFREKDHVLSKNEENIMAQMGEITGATNNIFTMLNNADLDFGTVTDGKGNETELTHGNYILFMEDRDRNVRKQAFEKMYETYSSLINTIGSTYNFNTKTDVVTARIRKYPSSRAAALSGDNIPEDVYDNLVMEVNRALPHLHKYMEIRKKLLGLDELKMYDVYVPLVELPEEKQYYPYEQAKEMIFEALAPMGDEYLSALKNGFGSGWVDVYENRGKTSGAYSFGSYDSKPFVLLNYTDTLNDVFTVIHEMGHSMHSYFTRKSQPFIYGGHSIFTAEVASTVNENLLLKHMLKGEKDPVMRAYLINKHIEEFRTTLFRQTMFAEFEHLTHKTVEEGNVLTPQWMCREYEELNGKYFGPALSKDPYIRYEWARIPHFYNAFYVYKYATGFAAAGAISDMILKEGPDDYLRFLSTGESDYPIELLKIAGVDMSSPAPIEKAMDLFASLVDEFESVISDLDK